MSIGNNNSRNIANLLKFEPLQPIKGATQFRNNPIQIPSRQRQQIPVYDVFTPDENERRNSRRVAPLSSGGNNRNDLLIRVPSGGNLDNREVESLKIRLDQIIKYYDQRHTNLQSKIMIRLNELENFVMKEVPKIDNTVMVSADIVGFKQALKQVRKQQQYQFNELNVMKAEHRERSTSDALVTQNAKQKQKMTVLFMQLVRLGDTIEKTKDQMNGSSRMYENRIQDLQQKLINSQKNVSIISQRTSSGSDVLNEFGDKMMNRLQSAQSNLLILGKQQIKDKQIMNRIVSQNERIGQDINTMITNMQSDFQNKLQNRMNETLNRLMGQHQQRIRAQQDIRKNLDIMERIHQQKQQTDKLQHKARLQNMDAAVRNQFIKKEESMKGIQAIMEQQYRSLLNQIQNQSTKRKEQEAAVRFQISKVSESLRRENDLYKNFQGQLLQKFSDMIKAEVNIRVAAEMNIEKFAKEVANDIVTDLNNVKQAISTSNKKLNIALKQIAGQSSERASQLSHYVDQQVKKVVQVVTQKYSKMKSVFTKLAQQFKNHLVNTQTNRKNHESRLTSVQQDFQKLKTQVNSQIDEFYNDLQARLKQQKQFVQTVVFKKNNQLTLRVNKLQDYTNQYFQVLKNGIQDNKQLLNNKVKPAGKQDNQDQIKGLRNIIFQIKNITEDLKSQNAESYRKIDRQIQSLEQKTKQTVVELGNNLNAKIAKHTQKITQVDSVVNDLKVKVNGIRAQSGSETAISTDRVKKMSDQIHQMSEKVKTLDQKVAHDSQRTDQQLIKMRSDITVLKGQVGALDDDLKKLGSVK